MSSLMLGISHLVFEQPEMIQKKSLHTVLLL